MTNRFAVKEKLCGQTDSDAWSWEKFGMRWVAVLGPHCTSKDQRRQKVRFSSVTGGSSTDHLSVLHLHKFSSHGIVPTKKELKMISAHALHGEQRATVIICSTFGKTKLSFPN